MLRAIKISGNKVFTGETLDECFQNAKAAGEPPVMGALSGWINEEGTFVTDKPSETVEEYVDPRELQDKMFNDETDTYKADDGRELFTGDRLVNKNDINILKSVYHQTAIQVMKERAKSVWRAITGKLI
jgi:hypothetical protein